MDSSIDRDDVAGAILEQNPEIGIEPGDKADFLSPIFKRGPRESDSVSWVCEVLPKYYITLVDCPVFIGFMRCNVRKYERVTQCLNCLRFGHPAAKCRSPKPFCAHCAREGHKADTCPHANNQCRCSNGGGAHSAMYIECSARTSSLAAILKRTDFGLPTATS